MRVDGNFNKKHVDFIKEGKKKIRERRKLAGTVVKHKKTMALCQGTRTKKHQRKADHKARMSAKDAEKFALVASEIEMKDAAPAPEPVKTQKAQRQKAQAKAKAEVAAMEQ